jgi:hypothetical protein
MNDRSNERKDLSRGIVFVAIDRHIFKLAEQCAQRIGEIMPDVPVEIFTDQQESSSAFSRIERVRSTGSPLRDKIVTMIKSPFQRTIYLDADTWVCERLDDVFDLLDRFDVAAAHESELVVLDDTGIPASFPEFNAGVVAFRKSTKVAAFLEQWLSAFDEEFRRNKRTGDQGALRSVVYSNDDIRFTVLPSRYNCRFVYGCGAYSEKVKILHTYASPERFRSVERALNESRELRVLLGDRVCYWDKQHGKQKCISIMNRDRPVRKLRIDFDARPGTFISGWHDPECHPTLGYFRWMGPETTSVLKTSAVRTAKRVFIEIYVVASLSDDILNSLHVEMNKWSVPLQIEKSRRGTFIFRGVLPDIPLRKNTHDRIEMRFTVCRAVEVSRQVAHSRDSRRVGLAISRLCIYPHISIRAVLAVLRRCVLFRKVVHAIGRMRARGRV